MSKALLMFSELTTPAEALRPSAERILAGDPAQTLRNHYSDPGAHFHCGEWTGAPGKWKVSYSEEEFCFVTRGRVLITDARGHVSDVRAGEAFVVPAGFEGVWEVLEAVHKYYVIYEPN